MPVGDYRAVVIGGWAFRDAGEDQVRITDQNGFGYRMLTSARPADLRGTVKFDKTRYESHETVRMWLTVTNIGGQTAERARLETLVNELEIADAQWCDFRPGGPGIRIPAGESRTFEGAVDVVVEANGGAPDRYLKATTDRSGRFEFKGVPSGGYRVRHTLADGWIVHIEGDDPPSRVEPGVPVHLTARAERPYSETLRSTVVFDKSTYAVGDVVGMTIS